VYSCFDDGPGFSEVKTDTTGFTVDAAEAVEEAEEVVSLASRGGDGGRGSSTSSPMGQWTGAGGEIVVAACSGDSAGGVLNPGGGTNGGASTFKGFPGPSPPIEGSIQGAGRDLRVMEPSAVGLPDGDLRHRSSCRLFARGRTLTVFPQSVETERSRSLIKWLVRQLLELKQREANLSSGSSTTGLVRIASSI